MTVIEQPVLAGKVYAITGGGSGIALSAAKLLAARGATVCVADIEQTALDAAAAELKAQNATFMTTKLNITERAKVDAWIKSIVDKFGHLNGAVNAAGVIGTCHGTKTLAELDDDNWHRIIGVNLTGTMYCLRAELQNIEDGGSIVNLSSVHGIKGFPKHAAYDASKHGIVGLTKSAALDNGYRGVRVNSVAPGAIYTPLMQKSWDEMGRPKDAPFDQPTSMPRFGTSEETAQVIAFLLGPESTFVTGTVVQVDGGWM